MTEPRDITEFKAALRSGDPQRIRDAGMPLTNQEKAQAAADFGAELYVRNLISK